MEQFSQLTRSWFTSTFREPTPAQSKGWSSIARGDHTLILAPTGSGKTLAAFLWAIDNLVNKPLPEASKRLRVLYVSPLKSLTYDIERNLRSPLAGIQVEAGRQNSDFSEIRVATRTGDTEQTDRRAMLRNPPDMLVTTPESLYLMLTSSAREVLASVEAVIIDEIHTMATTKRGAHLALSLERLELLDPQKRIQRIGLSATQRPLEEVARYLGGREQSPSGAWKERPVSIVDTGVRKQLELEVVVPVEDMGELGKQSDQDLQMSGPAAGTPEVRASIWPAIYPKLLELIRAHTSTLIFVNSRRLAERLSQALNELAEEELVRAHHGSVAREQRLEIEDALKAGKLPALVATSSLELGIDMGAIDLVVQVEAPPSVAAGLQRVGRAGHQVGAPSKGTVFPKFRGDLVVAAVTAQRMQAGLIEHTSVPRNPLDVLAQQVVAMVAVSESAVSVQDVAHMARGAYPFADLSDDVLAGVLDMLSGKYPSDEFAELRPRVEWDRVSSTLTARKGARMLAVTSGGTIPDRGLFGVFTPEGSRVGELDEEMVYESRVGETFLLGATTWKILEITKDRVVVVPAPGEIGKMPFWHGDALGRPVELGRAVGEFLRTLDDTTNESLANDAGLDAWAISNLRQYVNEEKEATGGLLPTDRQLVVQRFRDEIGDWRVCLLSTFGAQVHAPWALGIEAKIRQRFDMEAQAIWSDDGIVVRLPEADEIPPADIVLLDPDELDDLIVSEVGNSAVFAARFRENAARSLLLPRRRPGSRTPLWQMRQRSADLLQVASKYGEFPILLETYRECLTDLFDMSALSQILGDVRSRKIHVATVETSSPSPFASSLAFSYVASFMYDGDAPLAERRAQALTLDRRMLNELVGGDELRNLIDADALSNLELELQNLADERKARDLEGARDLLVRLGDLRSDELQSRFDGEFEGIVDKLIRKRWALELRIAGQERLVAIEDAARYRDAVGAGLPPGVPDAFLEAAPDAALQLVRRYARTHGPFHAADVANRFGMSIDQVRTSLERLQAEDRVILGEFRPEGSDREWCDTEVLRQLRQRSLAALRKEIEPAEVASLVRFLPSWQGVAADATGVDRLYEAIGRLAGVPIPASVLESDVLASRVRRYSPRMLDELLAGGEVVWTGAGPLGRKDGKVRLFTWEQAPQLLSRWPSSADAPSGDEHDRVRQILLSKGACFFRDLTAGSTERQTLDALWDLVWAGEVTNDGFASVRGFLGGAGVRVSKPRSRPRLARMAALVPPSAQGRWSFVPDASSANPTTSSTELAQVLLERHGVLTKEAVRGEGVPGGFSAVYTVLKALEESGRIRRGYFVAGLGGAQFALPGAVDRLRGFREDTPSGIPSVRLLAATDPANPFGVSLPWPERGPSRVAGAYVIIIEGVLSLYVEKDAKGLVAQRSFDGSWEEQAIDALIGLLDGRMKRLSIAKVPDELVPVLKAREFVPTPKGLVRYA